jgi:hypothetical protein
LPYSSTPALIVAAEVALDAKNTAMTAANGTTDSKVAVAKKERDRIRYCTSARPATYRRSAVNQTATLQ